MDQNRLVAAIRDNYLEQFRVFINAMRERHCGGASEVKFELPESADRPYRGITVSDFAANEAGHLHAHWFAPDKHLAFPKTSFRHKKSMVELVAMRWDCAVLVTDAAVSPDAFDAWFEEWFDPSESKSETTAEHSGRIHSLSISDTTTEIDFGTAPTEAFWQLLDLLSESGVGKITVG